MRISDWSSDVCSSDLGRSPAIGEIVEEFIARLGQDDTQKGYEAAIRTACYEPGNQENDEPAVDMEEVVGESRIFADPQRSEEHTSELQSLMRISYAVFCLKKKKQKQRQKVLNTQHNNGNSKMTTRKVSKTMTQKTK